MNESLRIYWLLLPAACIVVLDEWLKARGLALLPDETALVEPHVIDFAIHKNPGLAFDLPFRLELVIGLSILIGIVLARAAYKTWRRRPKIAFSIFLIILGALGNLYDRIMYGFTVDYIIVMGRIAINFSDALILLGIVALLILPAKRPRQGVDTSH